MKHPLLRTLPTRIDGDRIYLRPYQEGDGPAFFQILKDNADHLQAAMKEVKTITTEEEAEIRNRKLYGNWASRKRYVMPMIEKSSEEMIGEIWIEPKDWELGIYELGYFIIESREGKGIVTEASELALDFIFEIMEATKVVISTDDINERSYRVAERLGFTKEGHFRQNTKTLDQIVGTVYYGLLRSEYRKQTS